MLLDEPPLPVHKVNTSETRPALWHGGVPIELAVLLLGTTAELFAAANWKVAALVSAFMWIGAWLWIRDDYNAMRVLWTDIRTTGMALDSHIWGGSSVSAFPVKPYRHFRGISHAR